MCLIVSCTSSRFSGRTMPSAHASSFVRSLAGTFTIDMNTWIGRCCANSVTNSQRPRGLSSSISWTASARAFGSSAATAFGENQGFSRARYLVCSGGSRKIGLHRHRRLRRARHRKRVVREVLVVREDLVNVLAARQHPVPALARRPEDLGDVRVVQPLDRAMEVLVGARADCRRRSRRPGSPARALGRVRRRQGPVLPS